MLDRISLGTVQFGLNYGINNSSGEISQNEVSNILDYACLHQLKSLDTATDYGSSEQKIGNYLKESHCEFEIVSKSKCIEDDSSKTALTKSLEKLNVQKLYGYLAHDFQLFDYDVNKINSFLELKKTGLTEKTGLSLYYTRDLDFLLNNEIEFDMVQIPYNIFDQRFGKYFPELKKRNVEIHVRSCFLQGLVFMRSGNLPIKLIGLSQKLDQLNNISKDTGLSIQSLCMHFCLFDDAVNKVLLGVDNLNNLKENVLYLKNIPDNNIIDLLQGLEEKNEDIILPVNW